MKPWGLTFRTCTSLYPLLGRLSENVHLRIRAYMRPTYAIQGRPHFFKKNITKHLTRFEKVLIFVE
jgi:hypothetical protein